MRLKLQRQPNLLRMLEHVVPSGMRYEAVQML
jgi:hypothetical protein